MRPTGQLEHDDAPLTDVVPGGQLEQNVPVKYCPGAQVHALEPGREVREGAQGVHADALAAEYVLAGQV